MNLAKLLLFASSLALLGCKNRNICVTELSIDLPAHWSVRASKTNTVSEAPWWAQFNEVKLTALVEEALKNNTDLKASAKRLELAYAQAKITGYSSRPQLDVSVGGDKKKSNFIGLPFGAGEVMSSRAESYSLNFGTSWELDLWGRIKSGQNNAQLSASATRLEYLAARQSLAAQVVKGWFALCEVRTQISLAKERITLSETALKQIELRYELGRASAFDLRLAESNLHDAMARLRRLMVSETQFERGLEMILGRYPSGQLEEAKGLPSPSNNVPAGMPAQLLARRLDIAASVLRVRAADALVAEGKAGLLPRVSLTGSSGTSSNELKSLINGDFLTWSFGGSLAQTILLRDERNVRVHERELMTEEAVLNHRSVVMTAFEEVERALSKNVHLSEYRKQLNTVAEGTSDILVLARGRYENGTGSLKELMEAQNRSVESRAQLVAAQRQELENRVDLHLSLGGGFDLKEAENEASTSD